MSTFKITNITNFLGKRDFKANSPLDIEYVDNMTKKTITVKPKESVYLTTRSLPLSVHRLRVKNLITVSEISEAELVSLQGTPKPKKEAPAKPKATKRTVAPQKQEDTETPKYSASKKTKTTKKETEETDE